MAFILRILLRIGERNEIVETPNERDCLKECDVSTRTQRGSPHGVVVNVLNCDFVVSEFELESRCYVHFRTNPPRKGVNPVISPIMV